MKLTNETDKRTKPYIEAACSLKIMLGPKEFGFTNYLCLKILIPKIFGRDGILRECREHAHGRNMADCGRICGSPRKSVS